METAKNCSEPNQEALTKNLLTGLFFSRAFMEDAREFILQTTPNTYCLVAVDVLHFRMFNRFYGRDKGDHFLRHVAGCLEAVRMEYGGVTGHFEGDNFAILMPWRMELVEMLREDILEGGLRQSSVFGVFPTFGISPIDNLELPPEVYYDRATLALGHASAREHIICYDPKMEDILEEELHLLTEVTGALERGEFTFYAQPQCDIFTGNVVGAEALVRWRHPTKGLIPPSRFIPALERSGMISLLDQQVWEKVCQWLRSWIPNTSRRR